MKLRFVISVVILLGFLSNVCISSSAVKGALDARLTRDLFLIQHYWKNPTRENLTRLKYFNLPLEQNPSFKVFIHLSEQPSGKRIADFEQIGATVFPNTWLPAVGAHKTGFLLAVARMDAILKIIDEGLAVRVSAAYRTLTPNNNNAAEETGAIAAWEQDPPVTGEGVRLAILDSGFQLDHPDLPVSIDAMDYADYPDTSEDVTDLVSGHGTHVAGTAFGSGVLSDGRWQGMAPDVEAIYLKIGDDSTSDASAAAVVGALRATAAVYEADIASMSYGGFDGFNDGSSPEEQAVDWAVSEGVTVFMSAGNSAVRKKHYSGTVAAEDTTAPIELLDRDTQPGTFWSLFLAWYDGPDTSVHVDLSALIYDGNMELIEYDEAERVSSVRGTEGRQYLPQDPLPQDTSLIYIRVINRSDREQMFHLRTFGVPSLYFTDADQHYTVGLPSTADSCISVGAFVSRTEWVDFTGENHDDRTVRGEGSYFSSQGPRIDGYQKPNISAPGQRLISCRNTDIIPLGGELDYAIISNDGGEGEPADYIALMGTSMSSPSAAGTAALIKQTHPDFSTSQLRNLIYSSARSDTMTGEVPNYSWGWGKIDYSRALSIEPGPVARSLSPSSIELIDVYPNPFNNAFTVKYATRSPGPVHFLLFDEAGRQVWSFTKFETTIGKHHKAFASLANPIASGNYILRIGNSDNWQAYRITLIK